LSLSGNQHGDPATIKKAATNKILAKRENHHDHHFATGRRFHIPDAATFSSRLSRHKIECMTMGESERKRFHRAHPR
jgi:hypothetical protein